MRHSTPPRANISLMMLFVLALVSIMGVIATGFIKEMVASSNDLRDFYASYYLAKWGVEIGTTLVKKYDYGYESRLQSQDKNSISNITPNSTPNTTTPFYELNCKKSCKLTIEITSIINKEQTFDKEGEEVVLGQINNKCEDKSPFVLAPGQSYIIPLYHFSSSNPNDREPTFDKNNISFELVGNPQTPPTIWVVLNEKAQEKFNTHNSNYYNIPISTTTSIHSKELIKDKLKNLLDDTKTTPYNYLFITNNDSQDLQFCIKNNNDSTFVNDTSTVAVSSEYGDTSLSYQAKISEPLLDWIVRTNTNLAWPTTNL